MGFEQYTKQWNIEDILMVIFLLQLTMMKKKEPFLQEFDEGPLNFKPTYKFDRKADTYDTRYCMCAYQHTYTISHRLEHFLQQPLCILIVSSSAKTWLGFK